MTYSPSCGIRNMEEKKNTDFARGTEPNHFIVDCLLSCFPEALAIYQFGSFGTVSMHQESDLDLAILPTHPLDPVVRWEAAQKIAQIAGREVDMIDLLAASAVMRLQLNVVWAGLQRNIKERKTSLLQIICVKIPLC